MTGFDENPSVHERLDFWRNRVRKLEKSLEAIAQYGAIHTGCGYTCARMAREALEGQSNG